VQTTGLNNSPTTCSCTKLI